jgi:pSer/pThr/pTyr-binding forkhead associated (FHA) protein
MTIGLVCDACDALSPLNATTCKMCGESLGIVPARSAAAPAAAAATPGSGPTAQRAAAPGSRRCARCNAEVAPNFRFCGECGAPMNDAPAAVPPAVAAAAAAGGQLRQPGGKAKTMFFGAMQAARAKLILIKGDGADGVSYVLSAEDHVAGRVEGAILFPDDPLLSPRHANFFYKDTKLFVRDESSANGVFVRIIRPLQLVPGQVFLVGEQLLRIEHVAPEAVPTPDADGTYFYGSPRRPSKLALVQLLAGGFPGMVFRAREDTLSIGREGNDVNFPDDPFISGRHASISAISTGEGPRYTLSDLGSKNGTFVRIQEEAQLFHGDYVFVGQQLLRVEIT